MATDGGDIRFTFSGDSSGLNSELKKIDKNLGEVSKSTTGAANGLEKGLTKGAKAADKAASKMSRSIQDAGQEMDEAALKAQKMGDKMDAIGDSAGGVDSSLSGVGGAISQVNPAMGEMAGTAGDAAGALEGVMMAATKHPAIFAAVTVAVIAMGVAFGDAEEEMEMMEEAWEKADKAGTRHQNKLNRIEGAIEAANNAFHNFTDTGIEATNRALDEQIEQLENLSAAYDDSINRQQALKTITVHAGEVAKRGNAERTAEAIARLEFIREETNARTAEAEQMKEWEERGRRSMAAAAKREKELAEWKAREAAKEAERQAEEDAYFDAAMAFMNFEKDALSFKLDASEQIAAATQDKINAIKEEFAALSTAHQEEQALISARDVAIKAAMEEQAFLQEEQRQKEIEEHQRMLDKLAQDREKANSDELREKQELEAEKAAAVQRTASFAMSLTTAVATWTEVVEEQSANMTLEEQKRLFAAQKAAAISEAVINGAVAVTQSLAQLGPIAGAIAAAAVAATTAGQIALIAGEEPSFDVGGMVRGGSMATSSDQVSANLLPGEAVLNRSAAGRLGESGVNALNRGDSLAGGVVVVPAYRHFDRFIRDEYRKGGAFRRIVTGERQYPVGQRSY